MKIFYHSADLDGRSSAVIAMKKFPNAEVLGFNYHYTFDLEKIKPNEPLIFVDVFLEDKEIIKKLIDITTDITILDHHRRETAEKVFSKAGITYKGLIDTEAPGACSIVWNYYFPDTPMPKSIQYIGQHDTWDRNYHNVRFQLGVNSMNTSVFNKWIWSKILSDDPDFMFRMMNEGNTILRYLRNWMARYIRAYGSTAKIDNYTVLVVNLGLVDSSIFDSIPLDSFDIYARVTRTKDGKWKVSLTTNKDIDIRPIAKRFNGGGHEHACGLSVNNLEDLFDFNADVDNSVLKRYYHDAYDFIDKKI